MHAALQVERKIPTSMAASRKFGDFKPETERGVRTQKVETSQAFEAIKRVWAQCRVSKPAQAEIYFAEMLGKTRGLDCTSKDIEAFSLMLPGYEGEERFPEKAGLYLSALISNCKDDEFIIHTDNLREPIYALGYANEKRIIVEGDVGYNLGCLMICGQITVNGNAGYLIGGGMIGGTIIINGDAGDSVGTLMKSGRIYLNGGYGGLSEFIHGGEIFHKGKLIWPKEGGVG